ncbi:MAG: ribosome biogenesis GTP-binding protein YihA/YsxC [Gammaproteobacteria bacterium]|nr:ribosome biogenesis GTP-binding protein YihA/YsxC [Gammaproteobacteria bacterium]NNJ83389.1 YihA family ribosome biogenesis GTP-binding protein [Gammaproteobacteria bacterium]
MRTRTHPQSGQGVQNAALHNAGSHIDRPHALYGRAVFLCGAMHGTQLPQDQGKEVAFAGRSNVGKSSAINAITGIRSLARTSKTPGRTQQINFFELDATRRLVDLPGYGYAKVPEAVRRAWGTMVGEYLRGRQSLQGVVLLMDVRRPLMTLDRQLVDWCRVADLPFCVVLTKCDKLSLSRARSARAETLRHLMASNDPTVSKARVMLLSASRGNGIEDVWQWLDGWFEGE